MGETPRRRPRAWSMQFFGLLVLVLVLVSGTVAFGEDDPPPIPFPDEGLLLLQLGSGGNQFVWDKPAGADETQALDVNKCEATLDTTGDVLVTVDSIPGPPQGKLGLFDDGLGVKPKGKNANGQPCGRADGPDEGVIVALAGALADKQIIRAELDIEGKFNVTVKAELFLGPTKVKVGEDELLTGINNDSGPDSGDGDNYRWLIDEGVVFDEIRLTVDPSTPGGAFSLHGGADNTDPGPSGLHESVFYLTEVDGVVDCGEDTVTEGDAETTPEAVFTRGSNDVVKGIEDCPTLILYSLDSSSTTTAQTVGFVFDDSVFPSFYGTVTWALEPAVVPVPATAVSEGASGVLEWCDGFELDLMGDPVLDLFTGLPIPVLPTGESWCLVDQTSTLVSAGIMQVAQTIFGLSDPSFSRPR